MVAKNKNFLQLIVRWNNFYRKHPLNYQNLIYGYRQTKIPIKSINWFPKEKDFERRMEKYWGT